MVKKQVVKNKKQVVAVGGGNVFDESAPKRVIFVKVEVQRVFEPQLTRGREGKPSVPLQATPKVGNN